MATPDLKVRADALRAEAAAARVQAKDAYFKRRTELELERSRVATAKDAAEHSAQRASERAQAAADQASADGRSGYTLGQEAQGEARHGNAREAEETTELSDYMTRSATVAQQVERQATLDAAKFHQEAAGHELRIKELDFEVRTINSRNSTTEQHLDRLEDQARLYDEASRKFAAAEATDNIPDRAQFELDAEKALRDAEAIQVDRAAIRVFVPNLPAVTPGLPPTPTASAEIGDDSTEAVAVAAADDLGLDFTAPTPADDSVGGDVDSSVASAEEDSASVDPSSVDSFGADPTAGDDLAGLDMPAMTTDALEPVADTALALDDSFSFDAPTDVAAEPFESTGDTFDA